MLDHFYYGASKEVIETHAWKISDINPDNYVIRNSDSTSISFECKNCNIVLVEKTIVLSYKNSYKRISLFKPNHYGNYPINFTCAEYLIHKVIC